MCIIYIYIYIYICTHICDHSSPYILHRSRACCRSHKTTHRQPYGRFPKFHRVLLGREPGTLKSDIVSKKHPQLICSDSRLSNWKFEDWNYGNRPYDRQSNQPSTNACIGASTRARRQSKPLLATSCLKYLFVSLLLSLFVLGVRFVYSSLSFLLTSCVEYARSPLQDSRLFGPRPWKVLATTYEQK